MTEINLTKDLSDEDALMAIWQNTPSDSDIDMPSANKIFANAREAERAMLGHKHRRGLVQWAFVVVMLLLLTTTTYLLSVRQETRLVSSAISKGAFVLPDGSVVWLNKGSSLTYKGRFDGRIRSVSLEGEAFFDVSHDPNRPFKVHGKDMDITVKGTRFTVSSYAGQPDAVYLEDGSVTVKGTAVPETILAPGQGIVFDDNTLSWKKIPILARDHTMWIQDLLTFTNTSLSDVFLTLEHWFHISISCTDKDFLEGTRITMTVRQESPENVMESIAILTGMSFSREDDIRYIVRK